MRFLPWLMIALLLPLPVHAQNTSCITLREAASPVDVPVPSAEHDPFPHPEIAWYPDSQCIVVAYQDGLWLYDLDQPSDPVLLAAGTISHVAVNPADSRIAYSVTGEPTVYFIQADDTTNTLPTTNPHISSIAFSPDGALFAAASSNLVEGYYDEPSIEIWDLETRQQIAILSPDLFELIQAIFFTPDNQHLLADSIRQGYIGNAVTYWGVASAAVVWTYDDLLRGLEHRSENDPLAVSMATMAGQTVALGGLDGWLDWDEWYGSGIHIWDAEQQTRLLELVITRRSYTEDEDSLAAIALNSAGTVLASVTDHGVVQLWTVEEGAVIAEFTMQQAPFWQLAFSPDDHLLATLTDTRLVIWDLERMEGFTSVDLPEVFPTFEP